VSINAAIDVYSNSGGNLIELLRVLCGGDSIATETLAAQITKLQSDIFEIVRSRSGELGLSVAEIESVGWEYLTASRAGVDEIGFRGLMRYVIWIAWHDGFLRRV
jgi:hypothetical protein